MPNRGDTIMYALMQDGYEVAVFSTLQACQTAAEAWQYCIWIGG